MHTPGPWKVIPPVGPGNYGVNSEKALTAYGNWCVAVIPNGDHAEAAPNARLIAAAPALLEALEALAEYWRNGTPVQPGSEVANDALAAIAAARGEGVKA